MATSAGDHPAPMNLPILVFVFQQCKFLGPSPLPVIAGATYLCRTVDPAARAATALLGERPEEPTLVPLGVGPGCGEKQTVNIAGRVLFPPPSPHTTEKQGRATRSRKEKETKMG